MALKLEILLEAVDRLSVPLAAARARIAALAAPISAIASATARLGRSEGAARLATALGRVTAGAQQAGAAVLQMTGRLGAVAGVAGGVSLAMAGNSALSLASDMERYRITLTQVEGSAAAAERALAWVSDFSTRTPFEMAEVTRAFVDIRNLGLDPTRGALAAAGDAASIMGTRFEEAVTALSAALRGEMDPLERFGVFARTEGENIVMEWEANGRRMRAVMDKSNREMIARYVQAAWAQKFGGGMEQLARSWRGMTSNLADHWARFQLMVMRSGVFDWLKSRLAQLLGTLDRMAADGSLQAWATGVGAGIMRAFTALEDFVLGRQRLLDAADGPGPVLLREGGLFERLAHGVDAAREAFAAVQRVLEPIVGPFDALDAILAGIALSLASPMVGGLMALAGGLAALAGALIANPVGLAILAIGAIAALGVVLYKNWDGVLAWFRAQWEALPEPIRAAVAIITAPIRLLIETVDLLGAAWERAAAAYERFRGTTSQTGPANDPAAQGRRRDNWRDRGRMAPGPSLEDIPGLLDGGASPMSYAPASRVDMGGELRIRLEDGRVRTDARMNDPRARVSVDQGLLLGSI